MSDFRLLNWIKPWSPDQWAEIEAIARKVRMLRAGAKASHLMARTDKKHLEDARYLEWRARSFESRMRYLSDPKGKDIQVPD